MNNAGVLLEATDSRGHEFAAVDMFRAGVPHERFGSVGVIEAFLPLLRAPMHKDQAPLTPEHAVVPVLTAATLAPDARSGTFIDAQGAIAW